MIRYYTYCALLLVFSSLLLNGQDTVKREFLFKSKFDTSRYLQGSHIELKQILPKSDELIKVDIDDRDKISRSGYGRADYLRILQEYLSFEGDVSKSNRRFEFRAAYFSTLPEDTVGYTIQIEALYSFTRLLTIGYPPIRPTLVDRKTGEHLNANPRAVREVFEIYRKWYERNKKNDFKSISLPLDNTPFAWFGEDKMRDYHFRSDLFDYRYKQ